MSVISGIVFLQRKVGKWQSLCICFCHDTTLCCYYMRKAFKSLFNRLIIETHIGLLLSKRCRNMQSASDTKHDLFSLLSDVNQPLPKQLESFVDQLRKVCTSFSRFPLCLCSVFPLGAHAEAGGNGSLQHFNGNRAAATMGD